MVRRRRILGPVIELEPAGSRRPERPAPTVEETRVPRFLGVLGAFVLAGGAIAGRAPTERPRHHLMFDEPAPAAGAGESAAAAGGGGPVGAPPHIPDGWVWRTVGPLSSRQGNVAVWTGTEVVYWGGDRPGRPPEGAAYDPKADRWRRLSRSP